MAAYEWQWYQSSEDDSDPEDDLLTFYLGRTASK